MLNMRDLIPWSRGRELSGGRPAEHPLVSFQREMDRLFEDLWRGVDVPTFLRGERSGGAISPRIELSDKPEHLVVRAELPGLEEKDVEITLTEGALVIRGEKKLEKEEKEEGYTYSERAYGAFERRIPLEFEVLGDKVTAEFANGVLTVTLPKSPRAMASARRIAIGKAPAEQKAA